MSAEGEEWAEGVEDFFTEFAGAATLEKSQRRRNIEARQTNAIRQEWKETRTAVERAGSAEEARRRITAAVLSRASAKEIEIAARNAKKHQKKQQKNGGADGSGDVKQIRSSGDDGARSTSGGSHDAAAARTSRNTGDGVSANMTDLEMTRKTFGKKRDRVDAKFARKAARKEEAKENRIKYRRVLRKQRR